MVQRIDVWHSTVPFLSKPGNTSCLLLFEQMIGCYTGVYWDIWLIKCMFFFCFFFHLIHNLQGVSENDVWPNSKGILWIRASQGETCPKRTWDPFLSWKQQTGCHQGRPSAGNKLSLMNIWNQTNSVSVFHDFKHDTFLSCLVLKLLFLIDWLSSWVADYSLEPSELGCFLRSDLEWVKLSCP